MDGLPVIPGVGAVGHQPASGASRRTKVQVSVVVSVLNFVETHVLCASSTTMNMLSNVHLQLGDIILRFDEIWKNLLVRLI